MKEEYDKEEEAERAVRDDRIAYAKEKYSGDRQKESIRRAKDTYRKNMEKADARMSRLKERADTLTTKIKIKEKTKGVALGTSKTNYSDPRIGISWCKDNNVPVERLYTKTLLDKFSWAQDVEPDFYKKYPEVD